MDGLSAAAAILQVAQMAGQAAMKAHECISVIKNAPNEISAIKNDIMSFQTLVGSLEKSLSGTTVFNMVNEDPEMSEVILTLLSPIENCKIAMDRILQKMKPYLKNAGSSADSVDSVDGNVDSLSTGQTRINGVLWLFKRKEIFALSMELERTKSTFTGAMGNVNLALSLGLTMRTGSGNQFNKKNIEFNPDVGSSLLEYASTLDAVELPDDQTTKSIVHLQNPAYQRAPNLPSGPEAAKEIKAAVARGGVLLVKAILEHVHVDARDKKGRTALSHAAERGQLEMAQFLLDNGASVSARQWSVSGWAEGRSPYRNSGATPLWHATASGHLKMVKLLLAHGANPQARTTAGGTPLAMACQNGCTEIVKVLLSKGVDVNARNYKDGWAAIHGAVCRDHVEILKLLLDHGALVELPTTQPDGKTPLHFCVANKSLRSMKILLQHGADPNSTMIEGVTPLHLAAAGSWFSGIELLMEQNVFIDVRDSLLHETPLHKAARNRRHKTIVKLCELGANEEARNVDGLTYQDILALAMDDPDEWNVLPHLGVYISRDVRLLTHE